MCGICGTIGIPNPVEAARVVGNMNAAMFHRGPDEHGGLIAPAAAPCASMGMRRLSIIDLSGGHQPVFNEAGDVAIVFNGEIYNFSPLREQLERCGHVFRTHSDTETIVHAYEEWGEACLGRLRGMFGFAILDMRVPANGRAVAQGRGAQGVTMPGPRMLLARDRLGIKPFYYAIADGVLLFASEVRALLASGMLPRRLSQDALDSYLLFGSISEPMTLVDGVFSLPPGHFMSVPADKPASEVHPRPYWTFGAAAQTAARQKAVRNDDSSAPATLASAAKELRPLLEEAVSCHLIADVPLGVFLSSGLDSTALVALAGSARAGLHTFTVIFDEQDFSEAELARATAKRFGTCHEEFLLTGTQMLGSLDEAVAALDQPSMDGINTYFVSWAAHRVGLKVALSGLGGDEVFGGYTTFASTPRASRLAGIGRRLPRALRSATAGAVGRAGARGGDAGRKLAALWTDSEALPHPYFFTRALFTPGQVRSLRRESQQRHGRARGELALEELDGRIGPPGAAARRLRRGLVPRIAFVHGANASPRYRFRQHGPLARSPRPAHRSPACRVRRPASGACEIPAGGQQGAACRVAPRSSSGGRHPATQANLHIALGALAARSAGRQRARRPVRSRAIAGCAPRRRGGARSLAGI